MVAIECLNVKIDFSLFWEVPVRAVACRQVWQILHYDSLLQKPNLFHIALMDFYGSLRSRPPMSKGRHTRGDQSQGPVAGTGPLYSLHDGMSRGDQSLEGFTRWDLFRSKIAVFMTFSIYKTR